MPSQEQPQDVRFHRRSGEDNANTVAAMANPAISERELVATTEKTDRIAVDADIIFILPA